MYWHDCCQKWQQKYCQCIKQGLVASVVDWWIQEKALACIAHLRKQPTETQIVKAAKEALLQTRACLVWSAQQQQWVGLASLSLCSCFACSACRLSLHPPIYITICLHSFVCQKYLSFLILETIIYVPTRLQYTA